MKKTEHPLSIWRNAQEPRWSQYYLARRAGVKRSLICDYELGRPISAENVQAIWIVTGTWLGNPNGPA